MSGNKTTILKWIKIVFLVLVAWFLTKYFIKNYEDLKNLNLKINWIVFLCLWSSFLYIK